MKIKLIPLFLLLVLLLSVGCAKDDNEPGEENVDVVTTASIVDNGEAFLKAAGPDAFWLVAIVKDVTVDQDIILEGEYTVPDRNDPSKMVPAGRKIALYAQDADRNKTASYTLTAPKLIVKSKDAKIQGGTFVGDVYVEAEGFTVDDATIQGNVYFSSQELMDDLTLDNGGNITGETKVQ